MSCYIYHDVLLIVLKELAFSVILLAVQIRLNSSPVIIVNNNYLSVSLQCINQSRYLLTLFPITPPCRFNIIDMRRRDTAHAH